MLRTTWKTIAFAIIAGFSVTLTTAAGLADDSAVIRIRDSAASSTAAQPAAMNRLPASAGQATSTFSNQPAAVTADAVPADSPQIVLVGGPPTQEYYHDGTVYHTDDYPTDCRVYGDCPKRRWWFRNWLKEIQPPRYGQSPRMKDKLLAPVQCVFGYLIPTGCCGEGCPPFGTYTRVYAYDPYYTNNSDTQLYGAAGYGMPIAVPLAPVVGHQYNHSWGLPASRLTPVSNVAGAATGQLEARY
jgi:hypothetical protein